MSTYVFRIKGTTDALRGVLAEGFPARAANAKKMVEAMGGKFVNYFLIIGSPTIALVVEFDDPATPYRALRRRRFDYTYDDYAHLARVGEWGDDGSDGEA